MPDSKIANNRSVKFQSDLPSRKSFVCTAIVPILLPLLSGLCFFRVDLHRGGFSRTSGNTQILKVLAQSEHFGRSMSPSLAVSVCHKSSKVFLCRVNFNITFGLLPEILISHTQARTAWTEISNRLHSSQARWRRSPVLGVSWPALYTSILFVSVSERVGENDSVSSMFLIDIRRLDYVSLQPWKLSHSPGIYCLVRGEVKVRGRGAS